jgi:mannose-1-phosphate guanylyltransferase
VEKPDEQKAHEFLRKGDHSWNSGMFIWCASDILKEIKRQIPLLSDAVSTIAASWKQPQRDEVLAELWYDLKNVTVDYGIMENAEQVAVLPAGGLGWSDVGSWNSLVEVLLPDMNGNIAQNAHHLAIDTHNSLVYSNDNQRLVVTIGVDDMVLVDVGDVLLVCKADQAQKVRDVVEHLKKHRQDKYL